MKEWRMPAEWEPQSFIQLTWPHANTDWLTILDEITETYVEMADAITLREPLLIVHPHPEEVKSLLTARISETQMKRITYFQCETNDTWARDHGFISLIERKEERGKRKEERLVYWISASTDGARNSRQILIMPSMRNCSTGCRSTATHNTKIISTSCSKAAPLKAMVKAPSSQLVAAFWLPIATSRSMKRK